MRKVLMMAVVQRQKGSTCWQGAADLHNWCVMTFQVMDAHKQEGRQRGMEEHYGSHHFLHP